MWRDDYRWPNGPVMVHLVLPEASAVFVSTWATMAIRGPDPTSQDQRVSTPDSEDVTPAPGTLPQRLLQYPLLDPSFLLADWTVEPISTSSMLGREALVLAARKGEPGDPGLPWPGIRDYRFWVDLERGILLRTAGFVDEVEAVVLAVDSVSFDQPVPDSVFEFEPPAGTTVVKV